MKRPLETRTLQTWPRGTSYEYSGDPHGPADQRRLRVHQHNGIPQERFRAGKADEWRQIRIEIHAENYQRGEIYCCDSSLVDDLIEHANGERSDLSEGFSYDEIRNIYADPSDWDLETCHEYADDNGIDAPDPNPWTMDRMAIVEALTDVSIDCRDEETIDTLRDALIANMDDETIAGLGDWRNVCRDYAQDNPAEVYEWWRVSSWLCDKLHEIGEVTIDNGYGHWWGRTCTGQAYIMDGTLQKIAAKFEDGKE